MTSCVWVEGDVGLRAMRVRESRKLHVLFYLLQASGTFAEERFESIILIDFSNSLTLRID